MTPDQVDTAPVASIELREIVLRRKAPFVSSRSATHERRIILVAVHDINGLEGWGECSAPEEPKYCEEWTTSAWHFLKDCAIPLLSPPVHVDPLSLVDRLARFRGNRMAKAAVEEAFYDLAARQRTMPLWELLGGRAAAVPCGVAIGIQESVADLVEAVGREVEAGYRRVKLKIRPGWDVRVVDAVRSTFPTVPLMVDANGAYTTDDFSTLLSLDQYGLMMIEQPFAPDDIGAHHDAQRRLATPICLDESVVSVIGAGAAIDLRLCRIINLKLGRIGGHHGCQAVIGLCARKHAGCWCGGLHEAGIGRAHSLAMAASMSREFPAEISASARYWDEDVIVPGITVSDDGLIDPPSGPGIGFELNRDLISRCTVRRLRREIA